MKYKDEILSKFDFKTGSISTDWRSLAILSCLLVFTLAPTGSAQVTSAQEPQAAATSRSASTMSADDTRYRIGPGDVLTVVVRKTAELSGTFRVDQRGMIRIPMIDGDVRAACLTESELANNITTLYLEYKQKPSVDVFVSDFQSRPVSVIGAVNGPGQFRLQRRVRLLELLTFANGPAPRAGRIINVVHASGPGTCQIDPSSATTSSSTTGIADAKPDNSSSEVIVYSLNDTLKGKDEANPFMQPGDVVSLPDADQVFVIGHVNAPQAIPLRDKVLTVSRAIAMAGGPARDGKTSQVRIVRQTVTGEKKEIVVNLDAVRKQKAIDIVLNPDDIIEVGASTGKTILGMLSGAVPTTLANAVVRVIP